LADYSAGLAAYESGDFQTAHREWLPLAAAGDAQAQYRLGILYWKGLGVPKDLAQAAEWLGKAAGQGNAEAQASLALVQKEIGQEPSIPSEAAPAGEGAATSAPAENWQPVKMDCREMEPARGQQIVLTGFSVRLPSNPNWCIFGRDAANLAISTNTLFGKTLTQPPPVEEVRHSLTVLASFVEGGDSPVRTLAELRAVAVVMASAGPRFTVLRSTLTPIKHAGADCVRIVSLQEERNPLSPTGVFTLEVPETLVCLHPGIAGAIVTIGYSERYAKGYEPQPRLVEALKPELDAIMQSLAFQSKPPAPAEDKRRLAVNWDGFDGALAGEITYRHGERGGNLQIALPDLQTVCAGSYTAIDQTRGSWEVACPDGLTASGEYDGFGTGRGAQGQGIDSRGQRVRFMVGPTE
jgi:hypothetical protein